MTFTSTINREALEELARHLLPELPAPYVVLQSESPSVSATVTKNCWGMTGRCAATYFATWLQDVGRWRGQAPLVFVNDLAIRFEAESPEDIEPLTYGCLIHELGHLLDLPPIYTSQPSEPTELDEAAAIVRLVIAETVIKEAVLPPWHQHNGEWARTTLHLAHRARLAGVNCPDWSLWGDSYSPMPSSNEWAYTLDVVDERRCLQRELVSNVRTFLPGLLYQRRWRDCVQFWADQQTALSDDAARIVQRDLNVYPQSRFRE